MAANPTFANRHALVLGGAKGIGAALCHEFARRGARISVGDIEVETAGETAAAITASGGEAAAVKVDVLSTDSIA
ncbi:MAG TPA: SDR family NAD(P)-dependent oxidoreductase, partial [Novosphingobium sp.]|nr:SDR family NAD(P)-dependent oxidoreductase [Novosphingobium sp.]